MMMRLHVPLKSPAVVMDAHGGDQLMVHQELKGRIDCISGDRGQPCPNSLEDGLSIRMIVTLENFSKGLHPLMSHLEAAALAVLDELPHLRIDGVGSDNHNGSNSK